MQRQPVEADVLIFPLKIRKRSGSQGLGLFYWLQLPSREEFSDIEEQTTKSALLCLVLRKALGLGGRAKWFFYLLASALGVMLCRRSQGGAGGLAVYRICAEHMLSCAGCVQDVQTCCGSLTARH